MIGIIADNEFVEFLNRDIRDRNSNDYVLFKYMSGENFIFEVIYFGY